MPSLFPLKKGETYFVEKKNGEAGCQDGPIWALENDQDRSLQRMRKLDFPSKRMISNFLVQSSALVEIVIGLKLIMRKQ